MKNFKFWKKIIFGNFQFFGQLIKPRPKKLKKSKVVKKKSETTVACRIFVPKDWLSTFYRTIYVAEL